MRHPCSFGPPWCRAAGRWALATALAGATIGLGGPSYAGPAGAPTRAGAATAPSRGQDGGEASQLTASVPKGRGPVDVLYAGSLTQLMEATVGPSFDRATGFHFVGFAGGSQQLAAEIRGRLVPADVFISASPTVDASLEGKAGGNWLASYRVFATSRLVLAYNPHSRFAAELRRRPWYPVVGQAGFRLGRTDPRVDPKGVLAEKALLQAAARYHEPALRRAAQAQGDVFPEESLVGRLQSGQVDAGFFYLTEAVTARLPTVPLTGYDFYATYTVAALNRAPHPAGAAAFIAYLSSPPGRASLPA